MESKKFIKTMEDMITKKFGEITIKTQRTIKFKTGSYFL